MGVSYAPRARSTIPITTPAPYKGINTFDPLSAMDPAYAIAATNFIASPQGLSPRKGYRQWATGLPTTVTTLIPYHSGNTASSKQFAVSGSAIYDVTSSGAVGAAVVSGLNASAPYWQFATQTFGTGGGHYLLACNGADTPLLYDGTSWTATSQVTTPSAPGQFKTVDNNGVAVSMATFVDVILHQQRLWFIKANSTVAYYCDIAQAGGALYAFDVGSYFPRGGKLAKLASYTMDTGSTDGIQSVLVVISDKGDTLIYSGNNPAISTNFSLSAYYALGSPIGRRCTIPYQGDLLILSQDGLYALSKYAQTDRVNTSASLTYKISDTITQLVTSLSTQPGFEMCVYPGQNVLMLNIPQQTQTNNFQFCYHTLTQGWTQFVGWPAQCFSIFNDTMYFGGPGYVALAFIGYQDNANTTGANGNNIVATCLTAFTSMSDVFGPGIRKHVKTIKPFITTGNSDPVVRVGVNVDFNLSQIVGTASTAPVAGAVWNTALWDNPLATWGGIPTTYNVPQTVLSYPGEFLAVAVSMSSNTDTTWTATGWVIERAGQVG